MVPHFDSINPRLPGPAATRASAVSSGRQRGFTYIELIVVVVLIGVLSAALVENLLPLLGEAERVGVERDRAAMSTAVQTEVARRALRGERDTAALVGSNPVDLLERGPGNYLGEFDDPDPAAKEPGSWYFDRGRGELVYRVRHARYLQGGSQEPPRLRFRIKGEPGVDFAPVRLVAKDEYAWEIDGSELRRWLQGETRQ